MFLVHHIECTLKEIFRRLDKAGLAISKKKCISGVKELEFVGYRVNKSGIAPIQRKLEAIAKFPSPQKQNREPTRRESSPYTLLQGRVHPEFLANLSCNQPIGTLCTLIGALVKCKNLGFLTIPIYPTPG